MGVHQFLRWSMMNYWTFFVFSIFLELQPAKAQTEEVSVPIWVIGIVAGVVGLIVLIALFVVTFVCGWYASKKCSRTRRPTRALRKDPKLIGTEEVDNPGFHMSPVPSPTMSDIATSTTSVKNNDLKEIPRANVCLKNQLGTCAYGSIWDAEVVLGPQFASRALVKVLDAQSNKQLQEEFMEEASQLMPLVHPNVTRLFGVVTFTFPYYLALELPANGDLKSFLCTCRKPSHSIALTSNDVLLPMIKDAACGLAYLHSVPIVHRDVAARNCTVTNKLSVKISVYGTGTNLFVEEYGVSESGELVPIRWMAPELLQNEDEGSIYADVWAFGVMMWEIMSLGSLPYEELSDEELPSAVCEGQCRLLKPLNCKTEMYELMDRCWKERPLKRPKMTALLEALQKICTS